MVRGGVVALAVAVLAVGGSGIGVAAVGFGGSPESRAAAGPAGGSTTEPRGGATAGADSGSAAPSGGATAGASGTPAACTTLTGASEATPVGIRGASAAAALIEAGLPAGWARDGLPAGDMPGDSLDALGAGEPDLTGVVSGATLRWVTAPGSVTAVALEVEQRTFGTAAQAQAAETSWCGLLATAAATPPTSGEPAPAGTTGALPMPAADGGEAFGLPPGGPLGGDHAGITLAALHRAGRVLSVVSASPQTDLPPEAQTKISLAAVKASLPPLLAALTRTTGTGQVLPLSVRAVLDTADVDYDPKDGFSGANAGGDGGFAKTELPTDLDRSLGPPVQPKNASLAADGELGGGDTAGDPDGQSWTATLVRFPSEAGAIVYADAVAAQLGGPPTSVGGQQLTAAGRTGTGVAEVGAVTRLGRDVVYLFDLTEDPSDLNQMAKALPSAIRALVAADG